MIMILENLLTLSEIGDDPEILAIFDRMYDTVRNK